MNQSEFYCKLAAITDPTYILKNEPMHKHTTFQAGGSADFFAMPPNKEILQQLVASCKADGVPYYILGNGSNVLVGDKGYRGLIILTNKEMNGITVEGNMIWAQAGAPLSNIAQEALRCGLTGFEFAAGIPGTIGGAATMNAGAYGGEMKDVIWEITVLKENGDICVLPKEELDLSYRSSIISKKGYIVLDVTIQLEQGNQEVIRVRMEELKGRRTGRQPLEFPSAGSTFKRPEGYFAGKLIEDAGLRGFQVGGAAVSEKHCGFVINKDNATAGDIEELMNQVIARVKEQFGVTLEPEVKKIGEF